MELNYLTRKPKLDLRYPFVTLTWFEEGIASLIINRAERKNALNGEVIAQISNTLKFVKKHYKSNQLRALIIGGAGDFFCAGADLEYMRAQGLASKKVNVASAESLSKMMYLVATMPVLVMSSVLGGAFGGALGMIAASDIAVAESSALFSTSEVTLGLVPAIISPYLVRKLGYSAAASLMLSGERIHSSRAKEIGLINEVFSDKGSEDALVRLKLSDICRACPRAVWKTKQLVLKLSPPPGLALRRTLVSELVSVRASEEARVGLEAFLTKGQPKWHIRL